MTGAVQSFMQYGLTVTGFLLSLLTIFMSRSLADELVGRQIFLVMTKPLPRWQYVAGKWVGMTVLNTSFLFGSGLTIYSMVHYIKSTHPPIDDVFDQASLDHEVLVARHALPYQLPDFVRPAKHEYQRNLEEGLYENTPEIRKPVTAH